MCVVIDEPASVWLETQRKARKQHRCCECSGAIDAREQYTEITGIMDGRPFRSRMCVTCRMLWWAMDCLCRLDEPGEILGGDSILLEGLDQELTDHAAADSDVAHWQELLAIFEENQRLRRA